VINGHSHSQSCGGSRDGSPDTRCSEMSIPAEGAPREQLSQSRSADDVVTSFRAIQARKLSRTPRTPREVKWGSCMLATPERRRDIKIQGEDIANAARLVERLNRAFNEDDSPQQDIHAPVSLLPVHPRGGWGATAGGSTPACASWAQAARGATTGGISAPAMKVPSAWRRGPGPHVGGHPARASGHTAVTCVAEEDHVERPPVPGLPLAFQNAKAEDRAKTREMPPDKSSTRVSVF